MQWETGRVACELMLVALLEAGVQMQLSLQWKADCLVVAGLLSLQGSANKPSLPCETWEMWIISMLRQMEVQRQHWKWQSFAAFQPAVVRLLLVNGADPNRVINQVNRWSTTLTDRGFMQ
jgi:hypothetical protein